MGNLHYARSFGELIVYQKAVAVAQSIFEESKGFPPEEKFSLTDQVRRSSRSVGAQIAEAWGKRRYQKHFVSKLTDADAEQLETQHWISIAFSCGYLESDAKVILLRELSEIGRMLHSMIEHSSAFCTKNSDSVRENIPGNFESPDSPNSEPR